MSYSPRSAEGFSPPWRTLPQGQPYPGGRPVGAVQGAGAGVQDVVLDQHREGSQDEGEEQVQVDVVPGAVQPPGGGGGGGMGGAEKQMLVL